MDQIPRSLSGKILRKDLRAMYGLCKVWIDKTEILCIHNEITKLWFTFLFFVNKCNQINMLNKESYCINVDQ